MKQVYLKGILLVFLFLGYAAANAQDCGCDHVVDASKSYVRASDMPNVKPGDVVCIQAGVRGRLKFVGFQGTPEQPIIFKNCGGQVIFDNPDIDGTFAFDNCRYFKVTGTGSPSHTYGFFIRTASKGSAMYITESDFEVDHVEIGSAGFAGIMAKIDPKCDNTQYHRGNFVMRNISFHDNYIHNTRAEGFYIGSSFYVGTDNSCGRLYPHDVEGLRLYDNRIEDTGADGIQVGCATKDVEVYNNTIHRYGQNPFEPSQNMGIILNPGTTGKWYNNQVIDGTGMGIQVLGIGNVYLYNNLIVRPGRDGIFIDERSPLLPNSGFHVLNNTIVKPGRDGIRLYSKTSVGNTIINNIIAQPASLSQNYYSKNQYLYILDPVIQYTQHHNLFLSTVAEANFVDPANDNYLLLLKSPAIDAGISLSSLIQTDIFGTIRPQGAAFDIGAVEVKVESESLNAPSNLQIQPGSGGTASLRWTDNSTNELNFVLQRSLTADFAQFTQWTLAANTTAYEASGLESGKTYYYRLRATKESLVSPYSNTATVLLPLPAPETVTAPTGLVAALITSGGVKLNWQDLSTNETAFVVERSESSTFTQVQQWSLPANTLVYSDLSALGGKSYFYRVKATKESLQSAYSNTASLQVPLPPAPETISAPASLGAVLSNNGSIQLSWQDLSGNETAFVLERSESSSFTQPLLTTLAANSTSYTDQAILTGKTYYYRLKATKESLQSAYSNTASVAVPATTTTIKGKGKRNTLARTMVSTYPNPTQDKLRVAVKDNTEEYALRYTLTDLSGKAVMDGEVSSAQPEIDIQAVKGGTYLLYLRNGADTVVQKVIKK